MHRHDALFGQQVVQEGEDRLLVLARVFGAADEDHLAVKVHRDHGLAAAVVLGRIGLEAGAVDDGEIGGEVFQRFGIGAAQHGADEKPVPCQFCHHPHIDRMFGVGTANEVLDEVILTLHMGDHVLIKRIKPFGRHLSVVFPPDAVGHAVGLDHMFIFGRPTGEFASGDEKRAALA